MQKPQAVVFDLGKVLLDFDYARLAHNMKEHCSVTFDELLAALNQSQLLHRYETGLLTSQAFFEEVKRASKFRHDYSAFEPLFADIFTPIPEMIELHQRLQQAGVPTFIFSNTNEIAVAHIRRSHPFFREFAGYILSYEQRCMKPDPRIYQIVENTTHCRAHEILYIDDRPENVETAKQRGWQTIQHVAPERTIPRVNELLCQDIS